MKKLGLLVMPLMTVSLLASCGNAKKYKVIIPDINGVTVSPLVAASKSDYSTTITIDKTITKQILPIKLTSVKIGENECEYNYLPNNDYLSAKLMFAKSIVNNDITIDFSLRDCPWYLDDNYLNNLCREDVTKDDGVVQTIEINGLSHKVRLIDADKDVDENNRTIHTTWEFVDLISDKNGYSLASLWKDTATTSGSSHDYLNSTIRKNLVGKGSGQIMWYEKDGAIRSSRKQTVLDMLPSDLRNVLKIAKKKVNLKTTGRWVETDVFDELFLLSANEMHDQTTSAEGGKAYEYYNNATSTIPDSMRTKKQVKGADEARTSEMQITDIKYASGGESYAGYNSSYSEDGGMSWLRSPVITFNVSAFGVSDNGLVCAQPTYERALAVAPAFCI